MAAEKTRFSVISFNVNDAFEKRAGELQRKLLEKQRGKWEKVLFWTFPEAFRPGKFSERDYKTFLGYLGLVGVITPYETADKRPDDHVLVTAYDETLRKEIVKISTLRLANRNAVQIQARSPQLGGKITFIGLHLDDRQEVPKNESDLTETSRIVQAHSLIERIDPSERTIIAGDFNAMYETSIPAQLLRFIGRKLSDKRPASTDPNPNTAKRSRVAKLFTLSDMAIGATMKEFSDAGFNNADKSLFPSGTMRFAPGPFGPAIDHILHNTGLSVIDFGTFRGSSDHRGIAATFEVEQTTA